MLVLLYFLSLISRSQIDTGASAFLPPHAFYLSTVQITHQPPETMANIEVKVFKDDFVDILRNAFADFDPTGWVALCEHTQDQITTYFRDHFRASINGEENWTLQLTDCQEEREIYWLTFSVACPGNWEKVNLTADYFMELFPSQSNIVSVKHGEQKRFLRFTRKQKTDKIRFDKY